MTGTGLGELVGWRRTNFDRMVHFLYGVLLVVPFASDGSDAATLFGYLDRLPPPERFAGVEVQAPILYLPNVFEQEFCRHLVGLYQAHGG